MVRILSVYHFSGQTVDTVDDMSALTITDHNKLLVAQSDYSVEVKDLLSDKKTPISVFPTIDKVQDITHCAAGNYVATLEGKQTFQKSDVLIVRIYTNWESDDTDYTISNRRYVRPRIAGMVTPSSTFGDPDYLDMIEIPINFMSPTTIKCCQKTGKLVIACGPTIHTFNQIYKRGNSMSPEFMDFVAVCEVFDLIFQPTSVIVCEDVISACCSDMISVFRLKNVGENIEESVEKTSVGDSNCNKKENRTLNCTLDVVDMFRIVDENREHDLVGLVNKSSFPVKVYLKGINDDTIIGKERRFPFGIMNRNLERRFRNGKVEDNFIVTLSEQKPTIIAESLLALKINESEETISKIALQILPGSNLSGNEERLQFFFTTFQEGYLFYGSKETMKRDLQCVAVFNFTAQVMSIMFEPCVLHVLTQAGLETYNLPTHRSEILNQDLNVKNSSQNLSIFGMRPFLGVLDFIRSNDLITLFSSANDDRKGKESLPWTMYALKIPSIYEVYEEMISLCREFHSNDEYSYKYLLLEAFLILQRALDLKLPLKAPDGNASIEETHVMNAVELAELCFRSGDVNEIKIGSAVILACGADPLKFVSKLKYNDKKIIKGVSQLLKNWLKMHDNAMNEQNYEFIIELLGENGELLELADLLLTNENICRLSGYKAIRFFKTHALSKAGEVNVKILFVFCILCTQVCQQNDVVEALRNASDDEEYRRAFRNVLLEHWMFLFDHVSRANKSPVSFSELTSLVIEHMPLEISHVLSELIIDNKFVMADVVQPLLKLFPCPVSVQKGHLVLQTLLEFIFSSKMFTDFSEFSVKNCAQILMRSYLTQLFIRDSERDMTYTPIFVESLPDYVSYLPVPENISLITLRRLQEMILNKMLDDGNIKEVIEGLENPELKLNLLAMLNNFDFVKELMKNNLGNVILPYAKDSFHEIKKWRNLLIFVQNCMSEMKNNDENSTDYEDILHSILDHLAHTMLPSQLSTILETTIPQNDQLYQKYAIMAQRIAYANDVKELIVNTSQQLLNSNSLH